MGKSKSQSNSSKRSRPTPPSEFSDAVTWAAWLYYVDEMTQREVAETIGVSRVTVIKMLAEAKSLGIVTISISPKVASRAKTSRKLASVFGLNSVTIIPDNDQMPLIDRLGKAGAFSVAESVREGDVIGIAWGRTVLSLAENITLDIPVAGLTVVQVSASPNGLSLEFSPELCSTLFASKLGAKSINLLAPAIVSSPEIRAMLLQEPSIKNQLDVIRSANKVVFGVGDIGEGSTLRSSELHTSQTVKNLVKQGAVGTILGTFLDRTGSELLSPAHDRTLGISLDEFRAIPQRLCVAGGPLKAQAICAALVGGFATDLVIDARTAGEILEIQQARKLARFDQ